MSKNSEEFSMQEAMRLAKSDAGQRLYAALRSENSAAMDQAMVDAANGDYAKVREHLSAMLSSPQIRALMEQLRGEGNV